MASLAKLLYGTRMQVVHIGSANRRTGTIGDFRISMPHTLLRGEQGQGNRIFVAPIDCVMSRSWYTVNVTNNSFEVRRSGDEWLLVTLPVGYYDANQLRASIHDALLACGQDWRITYSMTQNKYTFVPPEDGYVYQFKFANKCAWLLGFDVADVPIGNADLPFVSTRPIRVNAESTVLVHVDFPRVKYNCVSNIETTQFAESDILFKIPITVQGMDTIFYQAQDDNSFKQELSSFELYDMRILLTDELGNRLEPAYDWTMTLRVEYVSAGRDKDMLGLLQAANRIADDVRLMILSDPKFLSRDEGTEQDKEHDPWALQAS